MSKKSSEINSKVDTWTNIVNIGLTIIGTVLISMGIIYMLNQQYDYLMKVGIIIVIAGIIAIIIGIWGVITHARTARTMKAQAKANLNY